MHTRTSCWHAASMASTFKKCVSSETHAYWFYLTDARKNYFQIRQSIKITNKRNKNTYHNLKKIDMRNTPKKSQKKGIELRKPTKIIETWQRNKKAFQAKKQNGQNHANPKTKRPT